MTKAQNASRELFVEGYIGRDTSPYIDFRIGDEPVMEGVFFNLMSQAVALPTKQFRDFLQRGIIVPAEQRYLMLGGSRAKANGARGDMTLLGKLGSYVERKLGEIYIAELPVGLHERHPPLLGRGIAPDGLSFITLELDYTANTFKLFLPSAEVRGPSRVEHAKGSED